MNAHARIIPAFDPDSADAQILGAFERVRGARVYAYSFDGQPDDAERTAQFERDDLQMVEDEKQVTDNVAVTLPGVATRLMLLIPQLANDRWIDRGLMQRGFLALYHELATLDGHAQQVCCAIHELIDINGSRTSPPTRSRPPSLKRC